MQFSVGLGVSLLGFVLVSLLPQPARGQVSSPRRFRAKIVSPGELHVSWKEPKGEFESYKVVYSTLPGGKQREVQVPKEEAKLLIRDFDPSKEYNFKIVAVRGRQQSKPLQAKHEDNEDLLKGHGGAGEKRMPRCPQWKLQCPHPAPTSHFSSWMMEGEPFTSALSSLL